MHGKLRRNKHWIVFAIGVSVFLFAAVCEAKRSIWIDLPPDQARNVAAIAQQCARMPWFEVSTLGTARRVLGKHGDKPVTLPKLLVEAGVDLVCSDQMMTSTATGKVVSRDASTAAWIPLAASAAGVELK